MRIGWPVRALLSALSLMVLVGGAEAAPKVWIARFKADEKRSADEAQVALSKALNAVWGARAELAVAPSGEPLGTTFLSEVVLAQLKASAGAELVITGVLTAKSAKVVELEVAVWRTEPPERVTVAVASGPESTMAALTKKIASDLEIAVELGQPLPKVVALDPKGPAPVVAGPAAPPAPAVAVETTNPVANWSLIGGGALVGVGLVLGIASQVAFNGPLTDGMVRDREENDGLIASGKSTAVIADVGLIAGLVVAAFGGVALLTDLGAVEVER